MQGQSHANSKNAILEWVNNLLCTDYSDLSHVPAKAAARILNGMYGEAFPITGILFDDASPAAAMTNCTVVLQGLKSLEAPVKLAPLDWLKKSDFLQILLLWRWIRSEVDNHPIPSSFDLSMTPLAPTPASADALCSSPASASGPAHGANMLVTTMSELDGNGGVEKAAAIGDKLKRPVPPAPLVPLEPNRLNDCPDCGAIAKRLSAGPAQEVERLQKLHMQLQKATKERDLNKILALLEQVDQPPARVLPAPQ